MVRKVLVSLVSDQTLPNYLFIKELQKVVDKYIFITTKDMEDKNKTTLIYETAGIDNKQIQIILVDENSLNITESSVKEMQIEEQDELYINLTGGTKMMAVSVWQYFKHFSKVNFYYVPIGKNIYLKTYHDQVAEQSEFQYKMTVKEYLKIYGIEHKSDDIIFSKEQAENIFNDVKSTQYDLSKFPKNKLKKLSIPANNKQIHTKWFEEFLYYRIKDELNLKKDSIKTGIKLFEITGHKNKSYYPNDNEIDVFFIYRNNPYLIEAKFSIGKEKINSTNLNNIIFKLSAVNKRFGLRAKATIMTLSTFTNMSDAFTENLLRRCKITGVEKPLGRDEILNPTKLKTRLTNFLK